LLPSRGIEEFGIFPVIQLQLLLETEMFLLKGLFTAQAAAIFAAPLAEMAVRAGVFLRGR
jgi:hypothetical protein